MVVISLSIMRLVHTHMVIRMGTRKASATDDMCDLNTVCLQYRKVRSEQGGCSHVSGWHTGERLTGRTRIIHRDRILSVSD